MFDSKSLLPQSIVDGGKKDTGSLKDFEIGYSHVDLIDNKEIDWAGVKKAVRR